MRYRLALAVVGILVAGCVRSPISSEKEAVITSGTADDTSNLPVVVVHSTGLINLTLGHGLRVYEFVLQLAEESQVQVAANAGSDPEPAGFWIDGDDSNPSVCNDPRASHVTDIRLEAFNASFYSAKIVKGKHLVRVWSERSDDLRLAVTGSGRTIDYFDVEPVVSPWSIRFEQFQDHKSGTEAIEIANVTGRVLAVWSADIGFPGPTSWNHTLELDGSACGASSVGQQFSRMNPLLTGGHGMAIASVEAQMTVRFSFATQRTTPSAVGSDAHSGAVLLIYK